jgi:NAD(P)-dependent dehydrogenase (short-subunit alcohol dehydrogenase family)
MGEKTVLITGASGLLGRQVVRAFELREWSAKGTGLSRADGVSIYKVDLNSSAEVQKSLEETRYVRETHVSPN